MEGRGVGREGGGKGEGRGGGVGVGGMVLQIGQLSKTAVTLLEH